MSQEAEYFKQFNQLYTAIHTETNRAAMNKHLRMAERMRADRVQETHNSLRIAHQVWSILYDEINRKKEQLRKKPGRQKAPDWFKKLIAHQERLNTELEILQEIQVKKDLEESVALLSESMHFSLRLIVVDQEQIRKQNTAGHISLSKEQTLQLQSATQVSTRATNFLKKKRK